MLGMVVRALRSWEAEASIVGSRLVWFYTVSSRTARAALMGVGVLDMNLSLGQPKQEQRRVAPRHTRPHQVPVPPMRC